MPAHDMTTASMITCAGCKHSYADTALFCPNCGTPKARDAVAADHARRQGPRRALPGPGAHRPGRIGHDLSRRARDAAPQASRSKFSTTSCRATISRSSASVARRRRSPRSTTSTSSRSTTSAARPTAGSTSRWSCSRARRSTTCSRARSTLSVERAADILIQVGEALMEAHAIGYVHRDLRPRNIFLAGAPRQGELRQAARLRPREARRDRCAGGVDEPRHDVRRSALHVARASARRSHRSARRHLSARLRRVRDADRRAAVHRQPRVRHPHRSRSPRFRRRCRRGGRACRCGWKRRSRRCSRRIPRTASRRRRAWSKRCAAVSRPAR